MVAVWKICPRLSETDSWVGYYRNTHRYDRSQFISRGKSSSTEIPAYNRLLSRHRLAVQEIMEQLLSVLYGVSGVAAAALYIPQILKYRRDREARQAISLLSWGGWIVIAAITILYALFVVKNTLIASIAALNIVAQVVVLFYGVTARFSPVMRAATLQTNNR